jgi:hypothetical protein
VTEIPRRALIIRLSGVAVSLSLIGFLGACYEHVVRAKGMGTERIEVYEPNLKEEDERIPVMDDAEDAVFGPKKPEDKKRTRR